MSTLLETTSGIINNGGRQGVAGLQHYTLETGPYLKVGEAVDVPFVSGPGPRTLFQVEQFEKQGYLPQESIKFAKPREDVGISLEKFGLSQITAMQNGYKLAGFREDNLVGQATLEKPLRGHEVIDEKFSRVIETKPEEICILTPELINEENSRYRYGWNDLPSNYGRDLPGSLITLTKGKNNVGPIVFSKLRAGAYGNPIEPAAGRYSGYVSAKSNASGTMNGQVS